MNEMPGAEIDILATKTFKQTIYDLSPEKY